MIFTDLDGTICESRQKISKEMKKLLSKLDLIAISGASKEQMKYQLDGLKCEIMAQSGNDTKYWKNKLTHKEKQEILNHINKVVIAVQRLRYFGFLNLVHLRRIKPDLIDDRGCQISLSLLGHNAKIEDKKLFDPDNKIRKAVLKEEPFISKTLECRIAGTTCFDYTRKDGTKGTNIARLIKHLKWNKKDCIYFGDKLQKGGNDESVIGVIKCIEVANPSDLMIQLKKYG